MTESQFYISHLWIKKTLNLQSHKHGKLFNSMCQNQKDEIKNADVGNSKIQKW